MPSHSERVRRNYHTFSTRVTENKSTQEITFNFRLSKASVASWVSPQQMAESYGQDILKAFQLMLKSFK